MDMMSVLFPVCDRIISLYVICAVFDSACDSYYIIWQLYLISLYHNNSVSEAHYTLYIISIVHASWDAKYKATQSADDEWLTLALSLCSNNNYIEAEFT